MMLEGRGRSGVGEKGRADVSKIQQNELIFSLQTGLATLQKNQPYLGTTHLTTARAEDGER